MRACLLALALLCLTVAAPRAQAAARRTPTLSPVQTVVDGPTSDIQSLDGMSVARDGTGGLVYLKDVAGVAHVFVSRLAGGDFQAPEQVDAGLPGASSQPVIAATNGGLVLVAFINGGQLFVTQATSTAAAFAAPASIAAGATDPSLSVSVLGDGYLVYTNTQGANDMVDYAYYAGGAWSAATASLNAGPTDDAGNGTGRPEVAACNDGIGVAVWGENGHIYVRRLIGATPSATIDQADPASIDGEPEVAAGDPVVGDVGFSTYAAVGFTEEIQVGTGGGTQSRVMFNRLHGAVMDGAVEADGTSTGAADGGDQPDAAVTEFGAGFLTSETTESHELYAAVLGGNSYDNGVERIDSLPNTAAPDAVTTNAGLYSMLIAWQQDPGSTGPAEIRLRYAPNGSDLGPEQVASNPVYGSTDADAGLVAGGDTAGDAAIAWVQGSGDSTRIVAAQLYQAPGSFAPGYSSHDWATANPWMSWSTPSELWGPITYTVTFDGQLIGTTTATTVRTPTPVANGRHVWQVTATNQAGLSVVARTASDFVDTVAPVAGLSVSGTRMVGHALKATVTATDPPPTGEPATDASGVDSVTLHWGRAATRTAGRAFTASHTFTRPGLYEVSVTVKDRAGNHDVVTRAVTVRPKPKPKPKPRKKKQSKTTKGTGG